MATKTAARSQSKVRMDANVKSLTKEEQGQLTKLDQELAQLKLQLGNVEVQIDLLQRQKKQLMTDVRHKTESFSEETRAIAEAHDIDPDSTTESWQLDFNKMQFKRIT